jgi:Family of unknown function (DUF5701)
LIDGSHPLPTLHDQVERLIDVGLHRRAGLTKSELRASVSEQPDESGCLLAIAPDRLKASELAPLLRLKDKQGFVVEDMTDVDDFVPIEVARPPQTPIYFVHGIERGDDMANWSPNEAATEIAARGRTPLTLTEGLLWVLQQPAALERNHCFMTIGSRLTKPSGVLDARTPALWISNGTGRDGAARRNAPKVGWCWAGNRHTWLGFASTQGRSALA